MALNPVTRLDYYPGRETAVAMALEEGFEYQEGRRNLGVKFGNVFNQPPPPDPKAPKPGGFFVAWDPIANKEAWRIPFTPGGGALSVAGQLIFVGTSAGRFVALHPVTGKTLWEQQLEPGIATPISYELDGKHNRLP